MNADSLWIPIIDLYMHMHQGKKNAAGNGDLKCKYHGYMDPKHPLSHEKIVTKCSPNTLIFYLFLVKKQTKKTHYAEGQHVSKFCPSFTVPFSKHNTSL